MHTAFQGGVKFCITASCEGGSFRICCIHECHSGGTCDAWYSCWHYDALDNIERKKSREHTWAKSTQRWRPEFWSMKDDHERHKEKLAWNLFFAIPVFKITVSESGDDNEGRGFKGRTEATYWSAPMKVPDLASPMYCNCLHHSLKPTLRRLRIVRCRETIVVLKIWSCSSERLVRVSVWPDLFGAVPDPTLVLFASRLYTKYRKYILMASEQKAEQ